MTPCEGLHGGLVQPLKNEACVQPTVEWDLQRGCM